MHAHKGRVLHGVSIDSKYGNGPRRRVHPPPRGWFLFEKVFTSFNVEKYYLSRYESLDPAFRRDDGRD